MNRSERSNEDNPGSCSAFHSADGAVSRVTCGPCVVPPLGLGAASPSGHVKVYLAASCFAGAL